MATFDLRDYLLDAALDGDRAALAWLVGSCTEGEMDALLKACRAITRAVRGELRARTQAQAAPQEAKKEDSNVS